MPKTVKRSVHVVNPEDHSGNWFHEGDVLPEWAEPLVTNTKVFDNGTPDADEDPFAEGVETQIDYTKLSVSQLDELLMERELSTTGTKPEKARRLADNDAAHG